MEELIWGALLAVIGVAVLFFVVKAAVKAAVSEIRAEDQAEKEKASQGESAAEKQEPKTGSEEEQISAPPEDTAP